MRPNNTIQMDMMNMEFYSVNKIQSHTHCVCVSLNNDDANGSDKCERSLEK